MVTFLELTFIFFVGSTLGWVVELIFRRCVHKKWINPGFLSGPCLPLYGSGLVALYVICMFDYSFIPSPVWQKIFVIAMITAVMTLIEYVTGLIFIKHMKIKLWDYSDRWGNIQGIICPLFTLFWGLIGAAYYLFVHARIVGAVEWLCSNLQYSFFVGMYFGVFAIDMAHSFKVGVKIKKFAADHKLIVRIEELKLEAKLRADEFKKRHSFLFPLSGRTDLNSELSNYESKKVSKSAENSIKAEENL